MYGAEPGDRPGDARRKGLTANRIANKSWVPAVGDHVISAVSRNCFVTGDGDAHVANMWRGG